MDNELVGRVRRIYASIAQVTEEKVTEVPVTTGAIGSQRFVAVDFREGLTDEELSNRVHIVVHNVANLADHLRRWARLRGLDTGLVQATVRQSRALQIVIDLSNNDKHGYPPRDGGESGLAPRLTELDRGMRMSTGAEAGSSVGFTIGADGVGRVIGSGSASIVITGTVVDRSNNRIGDLQELIQEAVEAWERLMSDHAA